ncbi:MAG: TonB-dependent receptor [Desulfobacterota bacterium]|nr:TonB-dependent receptor [Thermodesulfobacteriota bacterium]
MTTEAYRSGIAGIVLWCLTSIVPCAAQELPAFDETGLMFMGEELYTVTIASRKAEPLQRAPAAVTVIQGEELKKYKTLADVLQRVPGVFIDRNELKERIYMRGVPDSFLVMMDGVPFSSDASTIDYPRGRELSLEYIEKIEIVRGPGSALWGPDAFSGIINLVPVRGERIRGVAITGDVGSDNTRGSSVQAGFARSGWDGYVFGSAVQTEGFEHDMHVGEKRKDDHFGELYGRISYKDVFELSGRYSQYRDYYTDRVFALQGSEFKPFSFVQATLNRSFAAGALSLQGWYQNFDSFEDYGDTRFEQENDQWGAEVKYDRTLFRSHFATLGASFRYNDGTRTTLRHLGVHYDYFPRYDTHLISFYVQDKWKLTESFEATVGLRYDNHSEYRRRFSPRIGCNYAFWNGFNVKLLYGRAFRTPTLAVVIENPGLRPEQIDSYEIELGYHRGNAFGIALNYFYNDLKDIIERNAAGAIANRKDENIKGVEAALHWQPHRSFAFFATYAHLFGSRQKGTKLIQAVPKPDDPSQTVESTLESFYNVAPDNVFTFGIDYSFLQHVKLSGEMHVVDERKLMRGEAQEGIGRRRLGGYTTFDATLSVKDVPLRHLELAVKIKNITDKHYSTRGVFGLVDGEGCTVLWTLRYRF